MNDDQYKILRKNDEHILSVVNQIDRDLGGATEDYQELTLRVGALEGEVRILKDMIMRIPNKIGDKVDVAMQPAVDLKETIDARKNLRIEVKKRWFQFWR